jgi:hypothetical protein
MIGLSVSLSALLSSKPEKTWDYELKHLFSSTNIDEEYHLYSIGRES